jgi:hypothetical protein
MDPPHLVEGSVREKGSVGIDERLQFRRQFIDRMD